jgi:cellulose synthase/poly-beta-1,6-N-acetylglucosamine synthase-like glycosyltransferase
MVALFYILLGLYLITLILLFIGIINIKPQKSQTFSSYKNFSIVVVYRNEKENLPQLLLTFEKLDYPKENFEILMMDDGSDEVFDFSTYQLPIRSIKNKRISASPKKDAITLAVDYANHDWLVLTDADCLVNALWLKNLNNYLQKNTEKQMVCGSVFINKPHGFFSAFQAWDFVSLQATTIGSFGLNRPFMCNGANMAFTKTIFKTVDGYSGNNQMASGDDVFLLQKIFAVKPESLGFLFHSDFFVRTKAVNSFKHLIAQRARWGIKAKAYSSIWGKYLSLLIVVISLVFVWRLIVLDFWFVSAKLFIDGLFLMYFAKQFGQKIKFLLPSLLFYPFMVVCILWSSFFKMRWKA